MNALFYVLIKFKVKANPVGGVVDLTGMLPCSLHGTQS